MLTLSEVFTKESLALLTLTFNLIGSPTLAASALSLTLTPLLSCVTTGAVTSSTGAVTSSTGAGDSSAVSGKTDSSTTGSSFTSVWVSSILISSFESDSVSSTGTCSVSLITSSVGSLLISCCCKNSSSALIAILSRG